MGGVKLIWAKTHSGYPRPKDGEAFEAVYQKEHVPIAIANLPGKTKLVATTVLQSPQGGPSFYRIAEVYFPSMEPSSAAQPLPARSKRWLTLRKSPRADRRSS